MTKFSRILGDRRIAFTIWLSIMSLSLLLACCSCTQSPPTVSTQTVSGSISDIAGSSQCSSYDWKGRGKAPKGYFKGIATVFARAVCDSSRSDVVIVSAARTDNDLRDALSWYNSNFAALGMKNDVSGVDTLRHAYTLLIGLGLRESSGNYCCGRDMSAGFSEAISAEAGTFQASLGASRASPELGKLFDKYKTSDAGCLLDTFKEGASCSAGDAKNWGTGDGMLWQKRTKECPAFGAEYAAVLLRVLGGTKGEFGPLRRKEAEIRPECDDMLKQVQKLVEQNPDLCKNL